MEVALCNQSDTSCLTDHVGNGAISAAQNWLIVMLHIGVIAVAEARLVFGEWKSILLRPCKTFLYLCQHGHFVMSL